jgi:hypothetical protein
VDSTNTSNKYFCKRCKDQNYLIQCECGRCNKVIFKRDKSRRIREYAHNHHLFGPNNSNWNGGIRYRYNYRYLLMPDYPRAGVDGYVVEHVYVYEQFHKVCILPWSEIHHIDPVREGWCLNLPFNLMAVMKSEHRTLDRTKNMNGWSCSKCKSYETYIKPNGRPMWYYDKDDNRLCKKCYDKSKHVKKDRKKKDWTGTTCCLCGSDKTVMNHRGNYDWRSYQDKGVVCNKCYKKEYRKNKNK